MKEQKNKLTLIKKSIGWIRRSCRMDHTIRTIDQQRILKDVKRTHTN